MNNNAANRDVVGRVPSHGDSLAHSAGVPDELPTRRLRRLHRVWPDRDGNISYLLTLCVDGRTRALDNEATFERLVAFLLDSPQRYCWFRRRFVIMPDHIHLIAHMGYNAVRLGQWIKALKAVVGGLERRTERPVRAPGLQPDAQTPVGRVPSHGDSSVPSANNGPSAARFFTMKLADRDWFAVRRHYWKPGC